MDGIRSCALQAAPPPPAAPTLPCCRATDCRAARLDAARDGVVNYLPAKLYGAEGQLLDAAVRERRREERSLRAAFGVFAAIGLQVRLGCVGAGAASSGARSSAPRLACPGAPRSNHYPSLARPAAATRRTAATLHAQRDCRRRLGPDPQRQSLVHAAALQRLHGVCVSAHSWAHERTSCLCRAGGHGSSRVCACRRAPAAASGAAPAWGRRLAARAPLTDHAPGASAPARPPAAQLRQDHRLGPVLQHEHVCLGADGRPGGLRQHRRVPLPVRPRAVLCPRCRGVGSCAGASPGAARGAERCSASGLDGGCRARPRGRARRQGSQGDACTSVAKARAHAPPTPPARSMNPGTARWAAQREEQQRRQQQAAGEAAGGAGGSGGAEGVEREGVEEGGGRGASIEVWAQPASRGSVWPASVQRQRQ